MPIKHSFSILLCNFKLVAKLFIFILIILLITSAILIGIINPVLDGFLQEIQDEFPIDGDYFIRHPIKSIQIFAKYFSSFLEANSSLVATRLLYMWLLIMGSRFLMSLPQLPVTKILHSKMTTGFDMGLLNATVSTVTQNLLFSLVTAVFLSLVDIAIVIALCYITIGLIQLMGIIALPLILLIGLTMYSLRMTVFCQWLPEICSSSSKNIFKALAASFKPAFKNFRKNFICLFFLAVTGVTLLFTTIIPTMGLFPMLLVPTFMALYSAMCLTLNFSYHQRKYFIDNGVTIYNPVRKY